MDIGSILTIMKQIVDIIVGIIPATKIFIEGISSLFKARSPTSEAISTGYGDIAKSIENPEDKEKIDVERLRAFAELTRSAVPFAFVDYLYYLTKVAGFIGLAYVFYYWWYRFRSK